jgi:cell division GTPase FtsZ
LADAVLLNAVRGISDLITVHGLINLDFADVRTVMNESGVAMMGTGIGKGDNRAVDAAQLAISSPLLEDLSIDGARGVLINITGGSEMTLFEVNEASMLVQEAAHEDANIIFGAVINDDVPAGEIRVTVIATGLERDLVRRRPRDSRTRARPERELISDDVQIDHIEPIHHDSLEAVTRMDQVGQSGQLRAGRLDAGTLSGEFESPFEDELETPTFLRRAQD